RRGRQVAAEFAGVRREVSSFAGRLDTQGVVGSLAQTLIDPALTEQLLGAARSLLGVLGAAVSVPQAAPAAAPAVRSAPPPAVAGARVPLHPQPRPDYVATAPRVVKLRAVASGGGLADLEIEGKVR